MTGGASPTGVAPVTPVVPPTEPDSTNAVELAIARVLLVGTLVGIALLAAGVVLMATADISPNSAAFPPFEPSAVVGDLLALRPEGFLWAGIVVILATPIARVTGELIAFASRRDGPMTAIAVAILVVVALSVAVAIVAGVA